MIKKVMTMAMMSLLLCSCGKSTSSGEVHKINAETAKEMMQDDTVLVLDVRTAEEYEQGHIPRAILLPMDRIEKIGDVAQINDTILVYCRSGNRSAQAAQYLVDAGYTQVYDFGGILACPYETE